MGKLWTIIEDWRDGMEFPPSYRQIAQRMGVSQSTFDTWKSPTDMPRKGSLLTIARVTGVPYHRVVQAAVDDARLFDEASAAADIDERERRRNSGGPPEDWDPESAPLDPDDDLDEGPPNKSNPSKPRPKRRRRDVG